MTYSLINKMITKAGKRDEVVEIMLKSGAAFDSNPSCLLYLVTIDKKNENALWIEDVWADAYSHEAAMSEKSMQEYVKKAMPLLDGMPEQIEVELKGGKPKLV